MSLYAIDFYQWANDQAALLRSGNLAALDIANLIDEIEGMAKSEKRELINRLGVLLAHLLKWQYQVSRRSNSWRFTILEQRRKVLRVLKENPGLKYNINETVIDAYGDARYDAAKETNLTLTTFPIDCPWMFEQIIDDEFWPAL